MQLNKYGQVRLWDKQRGRWEHFLPVDAKDGLKAGTLLVEAPGAGAAPEDKPQAKGRGGARYPKHVQPQAEPAPFSDEPAPQE